MGIGEILLKELIAMAKETGLEILSLEVNSKNLGAIHLYKKLGFETIRVRKKYYHGIDDALIMNLKI